VEAAATKNAKRTRGLLVVKFELTGP